MNLSALLILTLIVIMPHRMNAQERHYHPFIEEGKEWTVIRKSSADTEMSETRNYFFEGDTIIRGIPCKRLMRRTIYADGHERLEMAAPIYEEGMRVMFFEKGDNQDDAYASPPAILYDFGMSDGSRELLTVPDNSYFQTPNSIVNLSNHLSSECECKEVANISIRDRELTCICSWDEWNMNSARYNYHLEGIGSTFAPDFNILTDDPAIEFKLIECRIGDRIIYTADNDPKAIIDSLAAVNEDIEGLSYQPFLEDGKCWIVNKYNYWIGGPIQSQQTYFLDGDTIIAGLDCKKLKCIEENYSENTLRTWSAGSLYEQDQQVYCLSEGSTRPVLLYDFRARRGDIIGFKNEEGQNNDYQIWDAVIWTEGEIPLRAQKAAHISDRDGLLEWALYWPTTFWIEGIGTLTSPIANLSSGTTGDLRQLVYCGIGNKVLYRTSNYSSIGELPHSFFRREDVGSSILYDLSGRRINNGKWTMDNGQLPRGVYIRDGKKVAVK